MIELGNLKKLFLFLAFQTMLAIFFGLMAIFLLYENKIPSNTYVGSINISSLSREEAAKKVSQYYEGILHGGSITIKLDGKREFKIDYGEIDASINGMETACNAFGKDFVHRVLGVINGCFFYGTRNQIGPVINYNEGKLRVKVSEVAKAVNTEPVNAAVYIKDGKVVKKDGSSGITLDVDNAINKLKAQMGNLPDSLIEFNVSDNYEVKVVHPQYTSGFFEDADLIISQCSTDISSQSYINSAVLAAKAINGVVVEACGAEDDTFSFNRCLNQMGSPAKEDDEGFNIVASTLYKAVLMAGIDHSGIVRTPHGEVVDYMEPGLDARILEGEMDLRFKNSLKSKLFIFAEVADNRITVSIVGNDEIGDDRDYRIETEVIQRFSPAVVNVESRQLQQGEKRVVFPGREGLKVNVYRVMQKDGKEVGREFLYNDKYDAIDKVVEIGPDTKWEEDTGLK